MKIKQKGRKIKKGKGRKGRTKSTVKTEQERAKHRRRNIFPDASFPGFVKRFAISEFNCHSSISFLSFFDI